MFVGMGKMGRRPRDPSGAVSKLVPIKLTNAEHEQYRKAADRAGLTFSEWARERLSRAASREAKRAK
jgi:hypothetical protein